MMFCPKCGSIMAPKEENGKSFLSCACGYSDKKAAPSQVTETMNKDEDKIEIVEGTESVNPVVEAECPDCGPVQAEFWSIQTRASDEPETQFFKCKKCSKTWKE